MLQSYLSTAVVFRMKTIAILVIVGLLITSLNYDLKLYTLGESQALLDIGDNTSSYTLIRDIKTSLEADENIELISINGIPEIFRIENKDFIHRINISLYINNMFIKNIINRYTVSYTGYSILAKLLANRVILNIYTQVLYGYRAFYTSICLSSWMPAINISIILNTGSRYSYIVEKDLEGEVVNINIDNISYILSMLSQYQLNINTINNSALSINIQLVQGRCIDILFMFSKSFINNGYLLNVYRNRNLISRETENFFLEILKGYPDVETHNTIIDNLYRYAVFSYINIVHGYPGVELCTKNFIETMIITDFAKITSYYDYILKNLARCRYINRDSIEDIAKMLYIYANAISSNIVLEPIDLVNIINRIEGYIDNTKNSYIYNLVELAIVRKALSTVIENHIHIARPLNNILNDVDNILTNIMYHNDHYILQWNRGIVIDISPDNVFEALSIAIIDLPNIDSHVRYLIGYIKNMIINKNVYKDPWTWISIAILLRYGYMYTAVKLLLENINNIALSNALSLAPLAIFIHGLLGLDVRAGSISLYPSIPREVANLNSTLYICNKQVSISIVGWGLKTKNIFLDSIPMYGNILSLDTICRMNINKIIIFMEIPSTIETIVRITIGGVLGRNIPITAISNIYSVSTITNNFGEAYLELPIDSDVWLYIRSVYGDFILKIHTPRESYKWIIEISIPLSNIDIDFIKSSIQNNSLEISRIESRVLALEERVSTIEKTLANISSTILKTITINSGNPTDKYIDLITILLSLASLFLSLVLLIFILRRTK